MLEQRVRTERSAFRVCFAVTETPSRGRVRNRKEIFFSVFTSEKPAPFAGGGGENRVFHPNVRTRRAIANYLFKAQNDALAFLLSGARSVRWRLNQEKSGGTVVVWHCPDSPLYDAAASRRARFGKGRRKE